MYKERQRPILRGGDTYHVLPYPDGANYDGMQYYNTKLRKGSLVLFKPGATAPDDTTVLLKGLERDKRYRLSFQDRSHLNGVSSGATLLDIGVNVTGMSGREASEVVWIEEVEQVSLKVDDDSAAQKLLFFDHTLFANVSTELELVLNQPTRVGPVVTVTEEWESYGIVAYHTVLRVPDGEPYGPYRLYYDCGWLQPDHKDWRRFTALAYSEDGVEWIKPNLGLADFNGSKANNIVWPLTWMDNTYTPGGFFIDTNPNATADARYKSICWWNRGGAHPTPGRGPFPGGKNPLTGFAI